MLRPREKWLHREQVDLDPFAGDVAAALLVADAVDSDVLAVTCFAHYQHWQVIIACELSTG